MDQNSPSSKTRSRAKGKRKGRGKEKATSVPMEEEVEDAEDVALSAATPERHPGLDERLKNLETHLALRYGAFLVHCIYPYHPLTFGIQQCLHHLEHSWRGLSSWKTTSSSLRRNTPLGRLCISTNRIAGYVSIVFFILYSTKSISYNAVASASSSHPDYRSSPAQIQYFFYHTGIVLNESRYSIDYTSARHPQSTWKCSCWR